MQDIANAYFKKNLAEYGSGPRKEKLNLILDQAKLIAVCVYQKL